MQSENEYRSLKKIVSELSALFAEILIDRKSADLDKSDTRWEQVTQLMHEIVDYLMWSPGTLVYVDDPFEMQRFKKIVDFVWTSMDEDEIFDEITGGGYGGLLGIMVRDYIDRAKMLRPAFVSIDPEKFEFRTYFEEAMRSWLFGLSNSALILSCVILESLLKEKLCRIDAKLVYDFPDRNDLRGVKQVSLARLIKNAFDHGLFDRQDRKAAIKIKDFRNNAVHKQEAISDKEVYDALMSTKELVEKLLT